jgi:hypothetical protein
MLRILLVYTHWLWGACHSTLATDEFILLFSSLMQSMAQQQCKNKERRLMRLFVCLHLTFLLQHIIVSPKHSPPLNRKNIPNELIFIKMIENF